MEPRGLDLNIPPVPTFLDSSRPFMDRIKSNSMAIKVMNADLKDNSDLGKIAESKENDYKRLGNNAFIGLS